MGTLIRSTRRLLAALTIGAALLAGPITGAAAAAGASGSTSPAFTLAGSGTWQVRQLLGDAVVDGTGVLDTDRGQDGQDVRVTAVIGADDRTLPGPGECEHAITWVTAHGPGVYLPMIGDGEVCGLHVQPPTSVVSHVFTGTFEVYGAAKGSQRFEGTDGFFEVRLADDGRAHVFAVDS